MSSFVLSSIGCETETNVPWHLALDGVLDGDREVVEVVRGRPLLLRA